MKKKKSKREQNNDMIMQISQLKRDQKNQCTSKGDKEEDHNYFSNEVEDSLSHQQSKLGLRKINHRIQNFYNNFGREI